MNSDRIHFLRRGKEGKGPVVYWMSRDQRSIDNWALVHAQESAISRDVALITIFSLAPDFLGATRRHYDFMLVGLKEVETRLAKLGIPFFLLRGAPEKIVIDFLNEIGASYLVTDFDPLRIKRQWRRNVAEASGITMAEVDSHNIVPCWVCSDKQEFAAYTIRPKIHRNLPKFMDEPEQLRKNPIPWGESADNGWSRALEGMGMEGSMPPVKWIEPGEEAALKAMREFISDRLPCYDERSSDPNLNGQSGLSPYLHFGQLSSQRVALEVERSEAPKENKDAFLEELVVRKELADNYCYFNPMYDTMEGFPDWAKRTLDSHRNDPREFLYSAEELEGATTHDDLWNAAQMEMVVKGKMHGYMRMYWAKKIMEWTPSVEEGMGVAIRLNDRYELDGRDPNGYTGIAWSMGGVHDRAWGERAIFGKIRYMSYEGAKRKFDVEKYIRTHLG